MTQETGGWKLDRQNLFSCLHFEISSDLLFKVWSLFAMMISNFSAKHKLHLLVVFGYSLAFRSTLHWMLYADLFIFQGPDVLQQWRAVAVSVVPHWMLVCIIMLLEGLRGQTSVIPLLVRRRDGCLLHHWPYLSCSVQRAVLLDAAVTWPPTRIIFANSLPRIELLCWLITAAIPGIQL